MLAGNTGPFAVPLLGGIIALSMHPGPLRTLFHHCLSPGRVFGPGRAGRKMNQNKSVLRKVLPLYSYQNAVSGWDA